MTSRSKNVNLNKEPFEGFVRHWQRKWVYLGDKNKEGDKGAFTLKLVRWVQTESRVSSGPARHPHICPIIDLSLVPGARVGSDKAAAAMAGKAQGMPNAAAMGAAAAAAAAQQASTFGGQMQQQAGMSMGAPTAAAQLQQQPALQQQPNQQQHMYAAAAAPSAFAGAAAAAAAAPGAALSDGGLRHAASLNALSVDIPSSSQQGAAGAATSAAGTSVGPVPSAFMLPSPSVVTGGMFDYSYPSGSQLQLQTTGSDFALYAAGAPSVGGAATASGYTAGTERTDSDALGRLPHASGPAASEYTDSMDVDMEGGAGASQGGASQQRTGGASMDTAGDMNDEGFDEAADEEDEEAQGDGDDELDEEGGDRDDDEDDDDEQGYEDDGLEGVADMP